MTTVTVHGREFDVRIDEAGWFVATFEGEPYRKETLKDLRVTLSTLVKSLVKIPVCTIADSWSRRRSGGSGIEIEDGYLVGLDQHGRPLYKSGTRRVESTAGGVMRKLTPAEKKALLTTYQESQRAETAFRDLVKSFTIDALAAVKRAATLGSPPDAPD